MQIGAQLYTLHEYTKTLDDFKTALERVADMGYTSVQVSGTCHYEPEWLAEQLKKNGLTCDLTHIDFNEMVANIDKVVSNHKIFNCKYIGIGGYGPFYEVGFSAFDEFYKKALPIAKRIKELDCKMFYHNHAHEFKPENGTTLFETLVSSFSPEELGFTLDVYWVKEGGHDPAEWLKALKGRLQCIHFKDMKIDADGSHKYSPVGYGVLDFDKIIQASYDAGTEYAFVEQDDSYDEDPFVCLKKSYDFLKSRGLK